MLIYSCAIHTIYNSDNNFHTHLSDKMFLFHTFRTCMCARDWREKGSVFEMISRWEEGRIRGSACVWSFELFTGHHWRRSKLFSNSYLLKRYKYTVGLRGRGKYYHPKVGNLIEITIINRDFVSWRKKTLKYLRVP